MNLPNILLSLKLDFVVLCYLKGYSGRSAGERRKQLAAAPGCWGLQAPSGARALSLGLAVKAGLSVDFFPLLQGHSLQMSSFQQHEETEAETDYTLLKLGYEEDPKTGRLQYTRCIFQYHQNQIIPPDQNGRTLQ